MFVSCCVSNNTKEIPIVARWRAASRSSRASRRRWRASSGMIYVMLYHIIVYYTTLYYIMIQYTIYIYIYICIGSRAGRTGRTRASRASTRRTWPTSSGLHMYTYIHTYMHAYIHTYIHTCIHTYIYIYIYIGPARGARRAPPPGRGRRQRLLRPGDVTIVITIVIIIIVIVIVIIIVIIISSSIIHIYIYILSLIFPILRLLVETSNTSEGFPGGRSAGECSRCDCGCRCGADCGHFTVVKIHQRGVQWKQGVVICMLLYTN